MLKLSTLLLIAGTGRNSGKTTFACSIIEELSKDISVIGLKISPHFHGGTESLKILVGNENFNLYQETSASSNKDSAKMLQAGATQVFYIETTDSFISEAFVAFTKLIEPHSPVVCESPALRNYVNPGLFFILDNINNINKKKSIFKWKNQADGFYNLITENEKQKVLKRIKFNKNSWYLDE